MTYEDMFQFVIDGDLNSIKENLDQGFNVNETDEWGFSILHRACANNRSEIAKLLIAKKSDLETTATDNWTPLHLAVISGSINCVSVLLESGVANNPIDKNGKVPLHLSVTSQNPNIAKLLIEYGANKFALDEFGQTPLELAESRNQTNLYEVLS